MTLYYGYDKNQVILAVKHDLSQEGNRLRYSSVTGEYAQTDEGTVFRIQLANGKLTDVDVETMTEEEIALYNQDHMQHAIITKGKNEVIVLSSDEEAELDDIILQIYKKHYKLTNKQKVGQLIKQYEEYKKHLTWFAQSAGQ